MKERTFVMKQNNMLAMILAGGRGSRLHELTNKVAKPAVAYGGKYKIIDFPLSNCANSGIDVVGVLTQYESVLLNSYVAGGSSWGLDARDSGVFVLPPREKACLLYTSTGDFFSVYGLVSLNFSDLGQSGQNALAVDITQAPFHIVFLIKLCVDLAGSLTHLGEIQNFRCNLRI